MTKIKPEFGNPKHISIVQTESEIIRKREAMKSSKVLFSQREEMCCECGGSGKIVEQIATCPFCGAKKFSNSAEYAFGELARYFDGAYCCDRCGAPLDEYN